MTSPKTITKAASHSADVQKLIEIFGLQNRQVCSLTLDIRTANIVTLTAVCEISEEELAALAAELESTVEVVPHHPV